MKCFLQSLREGKKERILEAETLAKVAFET
jgi:hypothetical protein